MARNKLNRQLYIYIQTYHIKQRNFTLSWRQDTFSQACHITKIINAGCFVVYIIYRNSTLYMHDYVEKSEKKHQSQQAVLYKSCKYSKNKKKLVAAQERKTSERNIYIQSRVQLYRREGKDEIKTRDGTAGSERKRETEYGFHDLLLRMTCARSYRGGKK